jgi:hypothetical protein
MQKIASLRKSDYGFRLVSNGQTPPSIPQTDYRLFYSQLNLAGSRRRISVPWQLKVLEKPMPEAEIKRLMKNLSDSINETVAESPKISECIQDIRDAGYEIFLVIEAKIGFSRNKGKGESETAPSDESVQLRITEDDAKFLKSLKISIDETL